MIHALSSPIKKTFVWSPQHLPKRGNIYQTKLTAAVYCEQRPICDANPNHNLRKLRLIRKKTETCHAKIEFLKRDRDDMSEANGMAG